MKYFTNRLFWIEAISDTALGTLINFPLNIVILTITFELELSAFNTSIVLCVVFTILAIVRKYIVRNHFSKKSG
jgi:hypothetical protein